MTTANSVTAVRVGLPDVTGGAYHGPLDTTLPTDSTTALDAGLLGVGFVTADGVVESTSISTTNVNNWAGDTVRVVQTAHDLTYKLTLMQVGTAETLKAFYGATNVTSVAATADHGNTLAVTVKGTQLGAEIWVFQLKDGDNTGRIVVPNCQITEKGDVSYVASDAVTLPITIAAYPDSSGNKAYIYWDDGQKSA